MRDELEDHEAEGSETARRPLADVLRAARAAQGRSLLDAQRDLRIKAAYLDAVESAELRVFPDPAYIPGYVRSYARYLGLDADKVYRRFCEESGFSGVSGLARMTSRAAPAAEGKRGTDAALPGFVPLSPAGQRGRGLPRVPLAALGSLLVLAAMVAGLGYGGWTVIQNIQRVQFAPVEDLPAVVAEIEAPSPPASTEPAPPAFPELASPVAAKALVELYRAQELEVPILVPRDGPIAALDPDSTGLLSRRAPAEPAPAPTEAGGSGPAGADAPMPQVAPAKPRLTVLAERPAWIRVYLEDGTVLFERILESGEVYEVPDDEPPPLIWAGNSGSVYVQVDAAVRGPLGPGTRAVRDIALAPAALAERYGLVEEVPEVISETLARLMPPAEVEPPVIQQAVPPG